MSGWCSVSGYGRGIKLIYSFLVGAGWVAGTVESNGGMRGES